MSYPCKKRNNNNIFIKWNSSMNIHFPIMINSKCYTYWQYHNCHGKLHTSRRHVGGEMILVEFVVVYRIYSIYDKKVIWKNMFVIHRPQKHIFAELIMSKAVTLSSFSKLSCPVLPLSMIIPQPWSWANYKYSTLFFKICQTFLAHLD